VGTDICEDGAVSIPTEITAFAMQRNITTRVIMLAQSLTATFYLDIAQFPFKRKNSHNNINFTKKPVAESNIFRFTAIFPINCVKKQLLAGRFFSWRLSLFF
jgi:hypothetical protein